MTSKRRLSTSAGFLVLVTGAGVHFFGEPLFSLTIVMVATIHLIVVMKSYPKIDALSVSLHYGVLAVTLTTVILYVRGIVGPTNRVLKMLVDFQEHRFLAGPSPAFLFSLVVLGTVTAGTVLLIARALPNPEPGSERLRAGFFVASIVAFSCDYSMADPLGSIGATRPDEARPFIFAAGLDALLVPMVLHILILLTISWRYWGRLLRDLQASSPSTKRPGREDE